MTGARLSTHCGIMPHGLVAFVVTVLTALTAANPAAAQDLPSIFRAETNWSDDEFQHALSRMPSLDDDLRSILVTLHGDYAQAFRDEAAAAQAAMDRAREAGRESMYVEPAITNPWRDAADRAGVHDVWFAWPIVADSMRTKFESDVREALADEALAAWDAEVRALRRKRELPRIREERRSRYALDLVPLLQDLPLSDHESAKLEPERTTYELACDAALIEWEQSRVLGRRASAIAYLRPDRSTGLTGPDADEFNRLNEEIARSVASIRDVHVASAQSMLGALDENRAELQDRLDRAWFEVVFLPSPVELAADALLEDSTIDEPLRRAVASIRERYAAAFQSQHRAIVDAMKRWESPEEVSRRAEKFREMEAAGLEAWGPDGPEAHHPAEPLLRRRLELAREGCAELRALFDDQNYPALPLQARMLLDWPASRQQPHR